MKKFNILHLSDLHIQLHNWNQDLVLNAFLKDIDNTSKQKKIDLVIFTGDLVFSGKKVEFDIFKKNVVTPLAAILNLELSKFIFVPGNHDIDRDSIDELREGGIQKFLKGNNSINETLTKITSKDDFFLSRLKNFNNFVSEIDYQSCADHQPLYSIYKYEISGIKIGVASLNSAWRSFGGEDDYGSLVIGEFQVIEAAKKLNDVDVKICAIHHPLDYLSDPNKAAVRSSIISNFDFCFSGHEHQSNPSKAINVHECIFAHSGCLYSQREYHNSYTFIEISPEENQSAFTYRTYYDTRKEFDVGTHVAADGVVKLAFNSKKRQPAKKERYELVSKITSSFAEETQAAVFTNFSFDESKISFKKAFIKPTLSNSSQELSSVKPEFKGTTEETQEILLNNFSYIITGKKESGKTWLLKHLYSEAMELNIGDNDRFPILIDYQKDLKPQTDMYDKSIKAHLKGFDTSSDLLNQINGNWLLLIDNFDLKYPKKARELAEFVRANPKIKFIIAANDNFLENIGKKNVTLDLEYRKLHIHDFNRQQTRSLVKVVCGGLESDQEENILNRVFNGLNGCMIPHTPLMISIALSVYRKESDYNPINKALLVEKFIDLLLEKSSTESKFGLSYKHKIDYLCEIAQLMIERNIFTISEQELESITLGFCQKTGIKSAAHNIIEYFLLRGLLSINDGVVIFKLKCFGEYFVANQMADKATFYDYIAQKSSLTPYSNELEYYSGIKRDIVNLIENVRSRVDNSFKKAEVELNIDIGIFEQFKTSYSITNSIERKQYLKQIEDNRKNSEGRDKIYDDSTSKPTDKDQIKSIQLNSEEMFPELLLLFGTILKNASVLKDENFKNENCTAFINYCSKLLVGFMLMYDGDSFFGKKIPEDKKDYYIKTVVPALAMILAAELFSNKVYTESYKKLLRSPDTKLVEKLLCLGLYSCIDRNDFLNEVDALTTSEPRDSVAQEILFLFLTIQYSTDLYNAAQRKIAEELIGKIHVKMNKYDRAEAERKSNQIKNNLQKKLLTNNLQK